MIRMHAFLQEKGKETVLDRVEDEGGKGGGVRWRRERKKERKKMSHFEENNQDLLWGKGKGRTSPFLILYHAGKKGEGGEGGEEV